MEAVQIPTPAEDDSDNVVTALETAAIFGAKGDATEAVRWLKRAAESAGADGRDDRALSLARLAAELAENSSAANEHSDAPASGESRERRLPKPPPRPMSSVRPPPPSSRHKEGDPEPVPLARPSATPMPSTVKPKLETGRPPQVAASGSMRPSYSPSPPKVVTSVRPGPPSQAPEPRVSKGSFGPAKPSEKPEKPSDVSRGSQTPAPASVKAVVSKPASSLNGASKSVAPKPSVAPSNENDVRPAAKAKPSVAETKPSPVEETNAPPAVAQPSEEPSAAPPPVAVKSEAPVVKSEAPVVKSEAPVVKSEAPVVKSEAPVVKPEPAKETGATAAPPATSTEPPRAPGRRQAARVSVEPSSGSKRFYVLRVLDEGEAVPEKGLEAFLVLTDPNARFPEG